ncbi:MAG: ABC-2 type transport system ATP-binding protein [Pseudoalteromonas tetraodonis]|jgi:ABC-2 type transport system ATP-binding protein
MKWQLPLLAAASIFISACGAPSVPVAVLDSGAIPGIPVEGRAGTELQIKIPSDVDGEVIAFTIIEPHFVAPNITSPLILHSHGYAGARTRTRPTSGILGGLLDEGMGVLSLDERGNGESGGEVRILDPEFEGKDWLQVLDWAEDNLEWLRYENASDIEIDKGEAGANPVMGAVGSSYGGGFQHLVYAMDENHRLDAIAPDITWNDLRYSLFSNRVFKTQWATLLSGLGSTPPNTQSQDVQEGLVLGLSNNTLLPKHEELLYKDSYASHCAGENDFTAAGGLTPIDAFYSQSAQDTLFNFNDMYRNYECTNALGGDVRLYVKSVGHGLDNGDGSDICANINRTDATVAWYREKLLHIAGAADAVPDVCMQLSGDQGDSIVTGSVQVGNNVDAPFTIPATPILTGSGGTVPTNLVIYDGAVRGANVIAGIPKITLSLHLPLAGNPGSSPESRADPIVFVGIGIREGAAGTVKLLHDAMTPFRKFQTDYQYDLIGVFERVTSTQQLVLVLQGAFDPQYSGNSSSGSTAVELSGELEIPLIGDVASFESQQQ